jgi:hypothetical protein
MKNYIGFVNDHSGSMTCLASAAIVDYNATITAVKDAATREMLDTVVSVVGIGLGLSGYGVKRQVVISNPHVLKPLTAWPTPGGTPLYDGVGDMIELFESLPDSDDPDVSFLILTTTDGDEQHSRRYTSTKLARKIAELQATGRWTFVFRVPKGSARLLRVLGVPVDNIQEWGTTTAGMAESTVATTQAVDSYFTQRSSGVRGSSVFYANASAVNAATLQTALVDVSKDIKLFVVPVADSGIEIKPFIEGVTGKELLKGAAFYQLTKTEARVQDTKWIVIRDRNTGKMYSGSDARSLIGLPTVGNARLHPGDHGNYDLFIQSTSINRKLVGGTGVLYWEKVGVAFKPEDLAYLQPKVVTLPAVPVSTTPTKSPLTPTPKVVAAPVDYLDGKIVEYFDSREAARRSGKPVQDAYSLAHLTNDKPKKRWFIYK